MTTCSYPAVRGKSQVSAPMYPKHQGKNLGNGHP